MSLRRLRIKNILLVREVVLDIKHGLVAITGETGSGKSIILDCILFLLGFRVFSAKSCISPGAESAEIEGNFYVGINKKIAQALSEEGITFSPNLVVKRVISKNGKAVNFINDNIVSSRAIQVLAANLISAHRQNEYTELSNPKYALDIIDQFGKIQTDHIREIVTQIKETNTLRNELNLKLQSAKRDKDTNKKTIEKMNEIELDKYSYADLLDMKKSSMEFESGMGIINKLQDFLINSDARYNFAKFSTHEIHEKVTNACNNIVDGIDNIESFIASYESGFSVPDIGLDDINHRLFEMQDIARQYEYDINDLHALQLELQENIEGLVSGGQELIKLEKKIAALKAKYDEMCQEVSGKRKIAAQGLEKHINHHLQELNMVNARVEFVFTPKTSISSSGMDDISFMVQTNPNMPKGSLAKVASGGELSRIMLAIKASLAQCQESCIMLFDEIDSGVSGSTSQAVANKLKECTKYGFQVILITHQAQISTKADCHILVAKSSSDDVQTHARVLTAEESTIASASLISGSEVTTDALAQVKQLESGK